MVTGPPIRARPFASAISCSIAARTELRKKGRAVRLERQPMDLLILLVERRGQLVTRAEIVELLWGPDVFVDVETGVHTAIRKVRRALGESPHAPAFVETVPGRGYRFIAPVGVEGPGTLTAEPGAVQARPDVSAPEAVPSKSPTSNRCPPRDRRTGPLGAGGSFSLGMGQALAFRRDAGGSAVRQPER